MNIITGYKGEAHITAQEDRDINLGVVGKSTSDLYVLDVCIYIVMCYIWSSCA